MEAGTRIKVKGMKLVTSGEWEGCGRGLSFFIANCVALFDFKIMNI